MKMKNITKEEIFMDVAKAFAYAENESNTQRFAAELKKYTHLKTRFMIEPVMKAANNLAGTYTGNETPASLGIKPHDIKYYLSRNRGMTILPTDKISDVAERYYQEEKAKVVKELKEKVQEWGLTASDIFPACSYSIH